MLLYSGACNFYYRGKGVFLCSPWRGLTWSSVARFCGGRCLGTLELATSIIETEGVFLCAGTTRERSDFELYYQIWRWKELKYSGACKFYYRGKRCVPLRGLTWSSIARFGSSRYFCTLELATSTVEAEGVFLCGSVTRASITRFGSERCICWY